MKRAAVLMYCLFCAVGLRAFDLQYGSLFRITDIKLEHGRPILPVTRGKYVNVRVLDKATFELLKTCAPACTQEGEGQTEIAAFRAAKTRPGMWIADVAVDHKWLLTFLVFAHKDGFSFITPEPVAVSDTKWLARVKQALQARAQTTGKTNAM